VSPFRFFRPASFGSFFGAASLIELMATLFSHCPPMCFLSLLLFQRASPRRNFTRAADLLLTLASPCQPPFPWPPLLPGQLNNLFPFKCYLHPWCVCCYQTLQGMVNIWKRALFSPHSLFFAVVWEKVVVPPHMSGRWGLQHLAIDGRKSHWFRPRCGWCAVLCA
jgi:hypothetical protein